MKKNEPEIAIIGTGAAAYGVMKQLAGFTARSGVKPHISIFDIAENPAKGSIAVEPDRSSEVDRSVNPEIRVDYRNIYSALKKRHGLKFPPPKTYFGNTIATHTTGAGHTLPRSNTLGGLTNYWGGSCFPFRDRDMAGWPVQRKDVDPYYRLIAKELNLSGQSDALNRYYEHSFVNSPPVNIFKSSERLIETINSLSSNDFTLVAGINSPSLETRAGSDNSCTYCGECLAGCYRDAIFSTKTWFDELRHTGQCRFIEGKVFSINPETRQLAYSATSDSGAGIDSSKLLVSDAFDIIFVAAGCIGSAEIMLRSVNRPLTLPLLDNAVFQFPIISGNRSKEENQYFALTHATIAGELSDHHDEDFQIQVYPNADYLWRNAVPEFAWPLLSPLVRKSRNRLFWGRLYLHSNHSYQYRLALADARLTFKTMQTPNKALAKRIIQLFSESIKKSNFYVPAFVSVLAKTSSHFAGSLAWGNSSMPVSDNGEIFEAIYISDSSIFPSSPACSPTFSIMANASRMTENIMKSRYPEYV